MKRRDYEQPRETNLKERMDAGASLEDGVSGRVVAQKDGANFRTYFNKDGSENRMKKYSGTHNDTPDDIDGDIDYGW